MKLLMLSGPVKLLSAVGTMMLGIVLARTLSKPDFGMYSFCMFVLVALSMLSRYGLESVLMRFGGSAWHQNELDRFRGYGAWAMEMTSRNAILISVFAMLLLSLFDFSSYFDAELMMWILAALLPWSLLYAISAIFKSAHRAAIGCLLEVGAINHVTWISVLILKFSDVEISTVLVAIISLCAACLICGLGLLLLKTGDLWPKFDKSLAHQRSEFKIACRAMVFVVLLHLMANNGGLFFSWPVLGSVGSGRIFCSGKAGSSDDSIY